MLLESEVGAATAGNQAAETGSVEMGIMAIGLGIREIWVQTPILSIAGLVPLGKKIKYSMAQFPHL